MPVSTEGEEPLYAVRIPADLSRPDRVLGPLTARQSSILAVAGVVLWLGYQAACPFMAPLAYLAMVAPISYDGAKWPHPDGLNWPHQGGLRCLGDGLKWPHMLV